MIESVFDGDREITAVGGDGTVHHDNLGVAVYGLGRTGLALSVLAARLVPSVTAADTNGTRVTAIQHGKSPVSDPLLSEYVTEAIDDGSLRATTELPTAAAEATIHLVAVSTGLRDDDAPDLSTLRATVRDIATELTAGDVIVITTPVPPGTTEGVVESTVADESGLDPEEFGLAVCALPTDCSLRAIRTGDLVVAGSDRRSQTAATELFSAITTGTVSTTRTVTTVECVGSVERTATEMLRCLSNELAVSTPDVDVPAVAELISMRGEISIPGPGVDGNEPIGAGFLRDAFVGQTPLLDSVYNSARQFPRLIAETVLGAIDHQPAVDDDTDTTVLVFGVPSDEGGGSAETMPVSMLIRELTREGTRPLICDPVADMPRSLTPHAISMKAASRLDPDAVVILSFRLAFEEVDWTVYDDAVVIDCCGSDLDGVDTDIHRLGAAETLQKQ
jgi:UDP-N-acetyl-D-mannosaminuronic acid dehydrogenase